MLKIIMTSFC